MFQKFLLIAFSILSLGLHQANGQSEATAKGANIVSGLFSFSSRSGDLYTGFANDNLNSIAFAPSYYKFVADKVGVGVNLSLNRTWQGDNSFSSFGIGPQFGYFFDNGSNTIPYVGAAVNFLSSNNSNSDSRNGYSTKLGGGVVVRIGHVGFSFEAGWLRESFKFGSRNISGNTIFIGAGLSAFFYKG